MLSARAGLLLSRRYQLAEPIATGGFGEVWRGTDVLLARPVAVKLLQAGYAHHPEALARFRAEARHAGALCHEGIAHVYDYGEPGEPGEPHPPFLVMELVEGSSLADVLAGGPLDLLRAVDVLAQAAAGLQAAHLAGLVHRDIKPGNLLISHTGRVKITDFGISHAVGSVPITRTGILIGTPGYLAPERIGGASATGASDLYSLGVVAYECLAGAPPFSGTPLEVALAHRVSPLPPLPPGVPAEVAALVSQLTAKDPAARPGSAAEVASHAGRLRDRMSRDRMSRDRMSRDRMSMAQPPTGAAAGPVAGRPSPDAVRTARVVHGLDAEGRNAQRRDAQGRAPGGRDPSATRVNAPPRRRGRGAGGWLGRSVVAPSAAAAAALAALTALALASVIGAAPQRSPAAAPSSTARPGPPGHVSVEVDASSLRGQPVDVVRRRLVQLGLVVRVRWRPGGQVPAGRIVSVQPGGRLPRGSLVTITGAAVGSSHGAAVGTGAASSTGSHGKATSHGGHKGQGKGNGNGNGNGSGGG